MGTKTTGVSGSQTATVTLGTPLPASETATATLVVPSGNATVSAPVAPFTGGAAAMGAGVGLLGVAGVVALVL